MTRGRNLTQTEEREPKKEIEDKNKDRRTKQRKEERDRGHQRLSSPVIKVSTSGKAQTISRDSDAWLFVPPQWDFNDVTWKLPFRLRAASLLDATCSGNEHVTCERLRDLKPTHPKDSTSSQSGERHVIIISQDDGGGGLFLL